MKKGLTLILLFCHMNFSMFLPQVAEVDRFNIHGQEQDDINSVIEFIDQIILGNVDTTPEDEDDDSGQHFLLIKTVDVFNNQTITEIASASIAAASVKYPVFKNGNLPFSFFDIVSPPPEV